MYSRIASISPYMEVALRKFYWNNIKLLKKYAPRNTIIPKEEINWNEVLRYLENNGIKKGALMILHSSWEAIAPAKITPPGIIRSLRELLGKEGTLAMPVIRAYKEEPPLEKLLSTDISGLVCTYNLKDANITTGVMPFFLTREKDVVISRNPLNSIAAAGPLAYPMMANNILEDDLPSCGKNSSWAFCVEKDAIVVGLGIDLVHSLTITHVAAELWMDEWPVKDWCRIRIFDVVDGEFRKRISVLERKPFWGCYYLAALNYREDLIKNNILSSSVAGGITVEILQARNLIDFLHSRIHTAYPYYIPRKYFK